MNDKFYGFYVETNLLKKFKEFSKKKNRTGAAQLRQLMQDFVNIEIERDDNANKTELSRN